MKKTTSPVLIPALAALLLLVPLAAAPLQAAEKGSLSTCQNIQSNISYYEALRRKGGSGQQMEKWRKERREQKQQFSRYRCKNWGKQLQT